jgi:L-amino acid N-acyltransferase YncA
MILRIIWGEIYKIWATELWPDRISPIEPNSAMVFNCPGQYDIKNMKTAPTFLGFVRSGQILGVTSGHACVDRSYRIRGTWVHSTLRGSGIAYKLIDQIVKQGISEQTDFAWTMPRVGASLKMFTKLGFQPVSDTHKTETGQNVYSRLDYANFHVPDIRPVRVFD